MNEQELAEWQYAHQAELDAQIPDDEVVDADVFIVDVRLDKADQWSQILIVGPCYVCGRESTFLADQRKIEMFKGGDHPERLWPFISADELELLMTGSHENCVEDMLASE